MLAADRRIAGVLVWVLLCGGALACQVPLECDPRSSDYQQCENAKRSYRQAQDQLSRTVEDSARQAASEAAARAQQEVRRVAQSAVEELRQRALGAVGLGPGDARPSQGGPAPASGDARPIEQPATPDRVRADMIGHVYRDLLGREPDPAGLRSWYESGQGEEQIRAGIRSSDEFRRRELAKLAQTYADGGGRILRVKPLTQESGSGECARVATVMLLNYAGFEVGLGEQRTLKALPEWAHVANDVAPAVETLSSRMATGQLFNGQAFVSGNWLDLVAAEIGRDRPIVALIPDGHHLGWNFLGHYVLIVGYQPAARGTNAGMLAYNDPWDGALHSATAEYFAAAWGTEAKAADGKTTVLGWQGVRIRERRGS